MKNQRKLFFTTVFLLSTTAFAQDKSLSELQIEVDKISMEAIQEIQRYPEINTLKMRESITARIQQLNKTFKSETDTISVNLRAALASLDSKLLEIQKKCEEGEPSICEKRLQAALSKNERQRKEFFDIAEASLKLEAEKLFNINTSSDIRNVVFKVENIRSGRKAYYDDRLKLKWSKESQVIQHDMVSLVNRSIFYNEPMREKLPHGWCGGYGYNAANLRQIITEDPEAISQNTSRLFYGKRKETHTVYYCSGEGDYDFYPTAEYLETRSEAMKRQGSALFSQCTDYNCTVDLAEYYKIWYEAMSSVNFNILVSEFCSTLLKTHISKSEFNNGIDLMVDLIKSSKD